jgi:AcrR family transcriptional regulator
MNIVHNNIHILEEKMPKIIENPRERIIIEAKDILIEQGYKGLNIREIAGRCGIGAGTFYNYFSNKQELATAIFNDDWSKTLILIENLKQSDDILKEKIRKIYFSLKGFIDNYISIFHEIVNVERGSYERHEDRKEMEKLYLKVQELLEVEKARENIKVSLSLDKLSQFIVSNLIYLSKNKFMSFEEMYEQFKI